MKYVFVSIGSDTSHASAPVLDRLFSLAFAHHQKVVDFVRKENFQTMLCYICNL